MNDTAPPPGPGTAGSAPSDHSDRPYTPPPGYERPAPPPSGTDSFFDGIRRTGLVRSEERWVGGVAGGLALRLGIDPLIVRGLLAASILVGGFGLFAYGVGWLLLPEQRDGRIHLQGLFRGDADVALLGALVVLVTGLSYPERWSPVRWWGPDTGWWNGLLWVSAVIVVVALVATAAGQRRGGSGPAAGPTTTLPRTTSYAAAGARPRDPGSYGPTPGGPAPTQTSGGPTMDSTRSGPAAPNATTPYPAVDQPTERYPREQHPTGDYPTGQHPTGQYPAAQYPAAQYPTAQYPTGAVGYAPRPTGPSTALPRPQKRGPGAASLSVVVALSLLTLAALLYAERIGEFDGPVLLTAGAVAVVLLGLAVLVAGLRGRTGGGLGALAVLGIIVLAPLSAAYSADWDWDGGWGPNAAMGELIRTPTDVATAEAGYSLGLGEARIDLTQVPLDGEVVDVPVQVGAGEVTIIVPDGIAMTGEVQVGAGEIRWPGEDAVDQTSGTRFVDTFESPAVLEGEDPVLHLDIRVGAGAVQVVEEG